MSGGESLILKMHLDPRVASLDQNTKAASRSGISMPLASLSRIEIPPWHFDPEHSDPDATWKNEAFFCLLDISLI